jgi:hypothetical protein
MIFLSIEEYHGLYELLELNPGGLKGAGDQYLRGCATSMVVRPPTYRTAAEREAE